MCVLQHTFYKMHASVTESNELNITLEHQPSATSGSQNNSSQNNTHLVNNISSMSGNENVSMSQSGNNNSGLDVSQQNHYNTNNSTLAANIQKDLAFSSQFHPEYQTHHLNYHNNIHQISTQNHPPPNPNIQHAEIENFHAKQTQRVDLVAAASRQYPQQQQQQLNSSQHVLNGDGYVLRPAISSLSIGHQSAAGQAQDDLVISRFNKRPQTIGGPSGFPGQGAPLSAARSVNDLDQLSSSMYQSSNPSHFNLSGSQQPPQATQLPLLSQPTLPTMGTSGLSYYRPAPDYETAIRNKYGNGILTQLSNNRTQQGQQQQASHPAIITDTMSTLQNTGQSQQQHNLPPSHKGNLANRDDIYNLSNIYQQQAAAMYSSSTPDLNKINQLQIHQNQQPTQDQIVAELQRLNLYKPPPPYPGVNSSSGLNQHGLPSWVSTPDLASQSVNNQYGNNSSGVLLGGSSPDLVSRRNLGPNVIEHKNSMHRTMENLVPGGGRIGYSTEELNTVYQLNEESNNNQQSNMLPTSPPQHLKPTQIVPPAPQQHRLMQADVIPSNTFKKRNLDANGEPIYQNQAELMQQMIATGNKDLSKEPIYQNLPAHES